MKGVGLRVVSFLRFLWTKIRSIYGAIRILLSFFFFVLTAVEKNSFSKESNQ